MADDEQFSLCWNNFNSNLSAGFHESLIRGDLVDVTLAAEGQFVKAHRLVLSVCSPYFRKMFTQMPANQHAFVFLKDVSHTALKDLIQFMYCGEVNVKQEALPAFISTAEALQIKGLTDSEPATQAPAEPATVIPTTQIHNVSAPQRQRQRTTTRTYKLETVDDTDDDQPQQQQHHQTTPSKIQATQIVIQTAAPTSTSSTQQQQHLQQVVQQGNVQHSMSSASATTSGTSTQKRPLRGSGGPTLKRTKNTSTTSTTLVDPLETANETITSQPQITVQAAIVNTMASSKQETSTTETAEYIDLPLELPSTKSEPDYADEAGDNDNDQDGAYVEDDAYGEMRYDESYFTEGEEGNASGTGNTTTAVVSKSDIKQSGSFTDSFAGGETGEQGNNDTQGDETLVKPVRKRGRPKIREDVPQEKLMDKLAAACARNPGQPTVYASTTKGAMKIIYEGHHFRYSFRKGQFSIFQCCYKENKEECRVRVVSDQKRIYPLDGEHIHFVQATDKSVTSMSFEPGEASELEKNVKAEPEAISDDLDDKPEEAENVDNNEESLLKVMQYVQNCGAQMFIMSRKGGRLLVINDFIFRSNLRRYGPNADKVYWECIHNRSLKCRSRLKTVGNDLFVTNDVHNHAPDTRRIQAAREEGMLLYRKFSCIGYNKNWEDEPSTNF